jgi:hypothetical protein
MTRVVSPSVAGGGAFEHHLALCVADALDEHRAHTMPAVG